MRTSAKKPIRKSRSKLSARYVNDRAYFRLKTYIDKTYSPGHYIGIVGGKIVADASDFDTLDTKLDIIENRPAHSMVVQAGVNYLTRAIDLAC